VLGKYPRLTKKLLSQVLGVSRRWFYRVCPAQPTRDTILKEQILKVWESHPSYGHRRLALALGVGKKKVRRCMQLFGLKPYKRKARWRKRRDERRPPSLFQNQIKNQCPLHPNYAWAGDFTYLPFKGTFVYLATFMDLFTREIVGWSVAKHHTKHLVIQALLDGVLNRQLKKPVFVHTDQGVEYTSGDYTNVVQTLGMHVSMSKKQSPWENGFQESFYNTFKTDLGLEFDRFSDEGAFLEAIHHTINDYNHTRIHTTLKMPPHQFYLTHRE